MRKWMILLLLCGTAGPAFAAKSLSVDQMEKLLATLRDKPDGKVAAELDEVQMTERVSPARLDRWKAEFAGPKSREELTELADMSAFLDPPADDVVPNARPDIATQNRILKMSVQYVENTISRLPDLFATRETTHFEDMLAQHAASSLEDGPTETPGRGMSGGGVVARNANEALGTIALGPSGSATSTVFSALHSTGTYSQTVTFRDGHEVLDEARNNSQKGLVTHGEFGPILAAILVDALRNQLAFARWEKGSNGPAAVFAYMVPANASHFQVGITSGGKSDSVHPAYHGEIAIDPGTGAILRFTQVAEMKPPYQAMRAAISVHYAPVTIAGRSYICPVSAVAYSKIPVPTIGAADESAWPVQAELNDIVFTDYHEFRSQARIITHPAEASGSNTENPSGSAPPQIAESAPPPDASPAPVATPSVPAPSPQGTTPAPASAEAQTPGNTAMPPATHAASSASDTAAVPDTQSKIEPTTIKVSSRLVVVDVVVRKGDHPVKGLQQSDFALYEDGVRQTIRNFTPHFANETAAAEQPPALPPDTWTNAPVANVTDSVTVLLLDGLNTQPSDVIYVRREMIRYLKAQPPDQRIAVFALGHRLRMLQGFTTDSSKLLAALEKAGATSPTSLLPSEDQIFQDRQQLSNMAVGGVSSQDIANTQNFMSEAGSQQTAMRMNLTLDAMQQLSRYLAGAPGRKNLIWFSGSFPLQFFAIVDTSFNGGGSAQISPNIMPAGSFSRELKATADILVAARVAVYPVDVRGVVTQPMFTSTQQTDYAASPSGPPMSKAGTGQAELIGAGQQSTFGVDQQMSQHELASEHSSMDILAQQTGGRAVYDSNGLEKAMAEALDDGSNFYTLAYVPTNTDYNGAQRNIEIRLTHGKANLFYRRSYYADPAASPGSSNGGGQSTLAQAAQLGAPLSTQILFRARVLPDSAPELNGAALDESAAGEKTATFPRGSHRYVIDLSLKPQDMPLAQAPDGKWSAQLQCDLIAYDPKGQLVNSLGREFKLHLSSRQYDQLTAGGGAIPMRMAIDLPAGEFALRLVLYDPASSRTGSLEIPIQVAAKDAKSQADASPR